MPMLFRLILLLAAVLCGGFVAISGNHVAQVVSNGPSYTGISFYWIINGALIAAPLWLPAVIPSSFQTTLRIFRILSSIALLFPTYLFGSIFWNNIYRFFSGLGATPSAFYLGSILTTACLSGITILLWPELKCLARFPPRPPMEPPTHRT